jgi:DNA-binding response OmpR family regulator
MISDKPKILIVDDEAPICQLLSEELGGRGYQCMTANSAGAALASLAEHKFDAVLLDIRLPDMSGVELLKKISASFPRVAPVMLTAVDDLNVAVQTMKAGALDYITKPFDFDRLDNALRSALSSRNGAAGSSPDKQDPSFLELEAIALGVETRQDLMDVHSEKVVQQTVGIARTLGFSEEMIQKWIMARVEKRNKNINQVAVSISRLAQNPQ